jgi:hypothetical protein
MWGMGVNYTPDAPVDEPRALSGRLMGESAAELPRRRAPFVETSNMMLATFINDPEHWLQRAEQMRILADEIHDEQAKETMLRIANDYGRLAERAEQRAKGLPSQ